MALVQVKAPAFLVREEGFNAKPLSIPIAGLLCHRQIAAHQIERFLLPFLPPGKDVHRTLSGRREQHLRHPDTVPRRGADILRGKTLALFHAHHILGRAADIVPVPALPFG